MPELVSLVWQRPDGTKTLEIQWPLEDAKAATRLIRALLWLEQEPHDATVGLSSVHVHGAAWEHAGVMARRNHD